MATAVVEVCPIDDVLDLGGTIEPGGLEDKGLPAIDPLQMENGLYADSALCSIPEPLSYQEEFKEGPEEQAAVSEFSYACDWTTTNIRLPHPSHDSNHQELFLCLPVHVTASELHHDQNSSPYEESKGYIDEQVNVSKQLRLAALNKYLASIPSLSQHNLFDSSEVSHNKEGLHRIITATNAGRIINVLQGEIAHCTPSQADVLVSDEATTCHIVALRSICRNSLGKDAILATMTHVDGIGYETCLRDAVMEHVNYHSSAPRRSPVLEESKENTSIGIDHDHVDISIYIMGGFNDPDGSSIEITADILQVFSTMARQFDEPTLPRPRVSIKLDTCVVSTANDDGTGRPIGRGLGLEIASGRVFLAAVEESNLHISANTVDRTGTELIAVDGDLHLLSTTKQTVSADGPEVLLRSVRLWAGAFHPSKQQRKLILIHRPDKDCLTIEPFMFGPHPSAKLICYMDDVRLLHMTSTSPLVEKSNFASKVRVSLEFMNRTNSSNVFEFANGTYQPIEYKRVGLNGWIRFK